MSPSFVYILALLGYFTLAGAVWFVAVVLAFPPRTRGLAKRLAAGMAGSFSGVFLFQFLAAPLVALVLLLMGGIFWLSRSGDAGAGLPVLMVALALLAFGIVAAASLLGFYAGWRAAWDLAAGRSPRAFLRSDRFLGPSVRFLRARLPLLQRVI